MSGPLALPPELVVVGDQAFSGTGFTGVLALPAALRSIGRGSFSYCSGITELRLPDALEHIKANAFSGCTGLTGSLSFPDNVRYIGPGAFFGCGIREISFGENLRSIGEEAFGECGELSSASFTGACTADYYGQEEKDPSCPVWCRIRRSSDALSWGDIWEEARPKAAPAEAKSEYGAEKDMPYYWTQGLTGEDFSGAGIDADVTLRFENAMILLFVNGRPLGEVPYTADKNDYERQDVLTDGFRCLEGEIRVLHFRDGYNRDRQLICRLEMDNGEVRRVVFHTGSEEAIYMDDGVEGEN
jgi:hypothetical protein